MAGLAEVLDENNALRKELAAREQLLAEREQELARLQRELADLLEKIAQVQAKNAEHELKLTELATLNDRLQQTLDLIEKQRQIARAERFIADQNQVPMFDDVQVPPRDPALQGEEEEASADEKPLRDGRKRSRKDGGHPRRGRRKLDDLDLPQTTVEVPVAPADCTTCGRPLEVTGTTTSHRLRWVPGHFQVLKVVREQCACPDHPGTYAATEPFLLERSMCDDGLLARVIVDKYEDHLPLNRQCRRMNRQGLSIGTNVLSNWTCRSAAIVRPVVNALMTQVVLQQILLSDDTGHPVQDRGDGQLRKGRMWVFTDQRQAFYTFSPNKKGIHPETILARLGFEGCTLVADGGNEYDLAEASLGLTRGGCWSHFRRYFTTAAVLEDKAKVVLPTFRDLFLIERELKELEPEARLAIRQERSAPLVAGIYKFIEEAGPSLRPKSLLAKACGYGLSQRSRMHLFLEDGRVPMHNNLSELLLRQAVVGRKSWIFSGSEGGAIAAAGWYSLISSAKLQGLDPLMYLHDLFQRLPGHPANRVGELTPMNWRLAVEAGELEPVPPGHFLK